MRQLSESEQVAVSEFFAALDDDGVDYVVLRKYEELPSAAPDDIDVFVDPVAFDRAIELSESVGFESEEKPAADKSTSPLEGVLRNPVKAPRLARRMPNLVVKRLRQRPQQPDDVQVVHHQFGDVKLDMVNHLRYPEWGGTRVPDRVERQMLENRRRRGDVCVPAPADELAHVVAHCLADYNGQFPAYYVEKIEALVDELDSDPEERERCYTLLEALYDDDARTIFEGIRRGNYDQLGERSEQLYRQPTLFESIAGQV